jgi:hypothetical protein
MDKLSDRKDFAPIRQWSDTDERWLISRFPFLSADCLKVAIELETDLSWARDKNPLKQTHEQMWSQMTALRERFLTAARRQLNELFLLAGAQHPQSPTARRILFPRKTA